jgi:ubiquinone/menaquinone biosynthesis C-methylase UbiE
MNPPNTGTPLKPTSSSDVLLANQLYCGVEAEEYDHKNHVKNAAILGYYNRLFDRDVFVGRSVEDIRTWGVWDVGFGTGFLEGLLADRVRSIVAFDATPRMLLQARQKFPGRPID